MPSIKYLLFIMLFTESETQLEVLIQSKRVREAPQKLITSSFSDEPSRSTNEKRSSKQKRSSSKQVSKAVMPPLAVR